MTETAKPAEDCTTMAEVRAGVDETDRRLIALIADRFAYMRAAARIKPSREAVRDEPRKRAVIAAAVAAAGRQGVPEEHIAHMWDGLVEASIAYEMERWEELHGG